MQERSDQQGAYQSAQPVWRVNIKAVVVAVGPAQATRTLVAPPRRVMPVSSRSSTNSLTLRASATPSQMTSLP